MAIEYSNLPIPQQIEERSSSDDTIRFFDAYNKADLQFRASENDAVVAFFQKKGMDITAAKSTTVIFLKQCKQDGVNPLSVIDQLRQFDDVKLTDTLGEILNLNRIKTSSLGLKPIAQEQNIAKRNIIA